MKNSRCENMFLKYSIPPVIKIDISRRIKEKIKVNKLLMPLKREDNINHYITSIAISRQVSLSECAEKKLLF